MRKTCSAFSRAPTPCTTAIDVLVRAIDYEGADWSEIDRDDRRRRPQARRTARRPLRRRRRPRLDLAASAASSRPTCRSNCAISRPRTKPEAWAWLGAQEIPNGAAQRTIVSRLGGPRDRRVEPALARFLEGPALVEQHDIVPLRALRLVHGQRIAVVEIVEALLLLPGDFVIRDPRRRPSAA